MLIDFNQHVIDEFRASGGRVGGYFEGARLLLLTTIGARSGVAHTTPLGYLPDGVGRVLVIGSAGGGPHHPDWYHNLVANPRVTVENGVFTYEAQASVLIGAEHDRVFARAAAADPGWAEYQLAAGRVLPVVALTEIPGPPNFNATSVGDGLKRVHDAFRRELALVRTEIVESGPGLGPQLRVNCLTVCQGLHHHHDIEDAGLFAFLGESQPQLAPAIDRLRREHERIAELLDELQRVMSADGADPAQALAEFDRLADELETHLTYEEDQLIPILDGAEPQDVSGG